jgi:hypothetical protein
MGWNIGIAFEAGVFTSLADFEGPNLTTTFSPLPGVAFTAYTNVNTGALVGVGAGP